MPGPALGGRKAACGIQGRLLGDVCHFDLHDLRTGCAQSGDAALESRGDRCIEAVKDERRRHGKAAKRQRTAFEPHAPVGQQLVQQHGVSHRARECAGRVERGRERHGTFGRRQPRGVLETDQTLQRRRGADRAAGIGAERRPGGTARDRRGAAGRRAARDAGRGVERGGGRVRRRAVVWIDAHAGECKFREVGATQQRRAGTAQARDCRTVCSSGRHVGQRARTSGAALALFVEQVFHADREAGKGRQWDPGRVLAVDAARYRACAVVVQRDIRMTIEWVQCLLECGVERRFGARCAVRDLLALTDQVSAHRGCYNLRVYLG